MKSIKYYVKKVNIQDIKSLCYLVITLIPGFIVGLVRKNIWVIAERPNIADDNGWILFKWVREHYPQKRVYFIIDSDDEKFKKYGKNIIKWGSLRHYIYYWASNYHINVLFNSVRPNHRVCESLKKITERNVNQIFLQHGVIKDGYEMFSYSERGYRLFICGAKPEYDYLKKYAGYPEKNIKYTGLARFDELLDIKKEKKIILLIPTWRRYIGYDINKSEEENKQDFIKSEYFNRYQSLINNSVLIRFLENNNIKLKFSIHPMYKKYNGLFKTNSRNIEIAGEYDSIHKLIMETSLMITDYSSVFFDAAYANIPVLYYHFDYKEFRKKHFSEGYFSYEKDGVGSIAKTEEELVNRIYKMYNGNSFIQEEIYIERIKKLFPMHDKNNCERIYNEIIKVENRGEN